MDARLTAETFEYDPYQIMVTPLPCPSGPRYEFIQTVGICLLLYNLNIYVSLYVSFFNWTITRYII